MSTELDKVINFINETYEIMKAKHLEDVTEAYSGYRAAYSKETINAKDFLHIKKLAACDPEVKKGILKLMEVAAAFSEWNIHTNGILFDKYMMSLKAGQTQNEDSYQILQAEPELGSDMIIPITNAVISKQKLSPEDAMDLQLKCEIIVDTYNKFIQSEMVRDMDLGESSTYQIRCIEGLAQGLSSYRQSKTKSENKSEGITSEDQDEQQNIRLNEIAFMCVDSPELANAHIEGFQESSLESSLFYLENTLNDLEDRATEALIAYQIEESQKALKKTSGSFRSKAGVFFMGKSSGDIGNISSTSMDEVKENLLGLKNYMAEKPKPKPIAEDADFNSKLKYYKELVAYKATLEKKIDLVANNREKNTKKMKNS